VIEYVAAQLDMPFIRAYEVATFYTMMTWRRSAATTCRCAAPPRAC
jgi:NADH:ubiquinone oxidoreductase subunit E